MTDNNIFKYDVIFVGSKSYHHEWQYRTKLINWLEDTYGEHFALFGRDGKGEIRGDNLNRLYCSSKIVIGDTLSKNFKYPYYFSDRVFETTGRGGVIIHPYIKGLEECFKLPILKQDGSLDTSKAEIITYPYGNFDYLKYLIDYYLKNEIEREEIRLRGFIRTQKDHTYTNRLRYILEIIKHETDGN
jgi:hypothetical protein